MGKITQATTKFRFRTERGSCGKWPGSSEMATSSWRLEDLHQLEELGLAGQLESTKLQEKGTYKEAPHASEYTDEPDLNSVLSDLLMAPAVPPGGPAPGFPSQRAVEVVLLSPTANVVNHGGPDVTYINRGQWYEIRISSTVQEPQGQYRCVVSAGFSELRMRNNERELLECWSQEHPCERLLDIDRRGCEGVSHIKDFENLNSSSFLWQPVQCATISIRINCLSSEFAAKKHGGEKGVLLQVCMDFHSVDSESCLQGLRCDVKVFKDKGGDRKQKQDQLKMEKLSPIERSKYRVSQEVTRFEVVSQSAPPPLPSWEIPCSPQPTVPPTISQQLSQGAISASSSIEDVQLWLTGHHFSTYLTLFGNYSGADLLRLSRRDLVELCGPADGIRLFNSLRSRTLCTVYVCLEDKSVYQAISLEELTAREFAGKLAEKVGLKYSQVSSVLQLTSSGILVMVDDTVVRNFCDEDSYVVGAVKDETGSYRLLLRCQPHSLQTTPSNTHDSTLDSSTEHSHFNNQ